MAWLGVGCMVFLLAMVFRIAAADRRYASGAIVIDNPPFPPDFEFPSAALVLPAALDRKTMDVLGKPLLDDEGRRPYEKTGGYESGAPVTRLPKVPPGPAAGS